MNCYLCNSTHHHLRSGTVRDKPEMLINECDDCGLVSLGHTTHIKPGFYENSGMHGENIQPITSWLKETEWDDTSTTTSRLI